MSYFWTNFFYSPRWRNLVAKFVVSYLLQVAIILVFVAIMTCLNIWYTVDDKLSMTYNHSDKLRIDTKISYKKIYIDLTYWFWQTYPLHI